MPDLRLPEAAWGNPHGRVMKRKRPDINFDIAIDADSQVNHFKHQKNTDGHDSIDLTPSHRILDVLGSAATESARKISTREPQPSLPSAPMLGTQSHPVSKLARPQFPAPLRRSQSSQPVPIEGKVIQKWDSKEWDGDEFDSDDENMSLAVTMKLATELSLLKSFLETYRKFNIHLGGKQELLYTQLRMMHFLSLTQANHFQRSYRAPATKVSSPSFPQPSAKSNRTPHTCEPSATRSNAAIPPPASWNSSPRRLLADASLAVNICGKLWRRRWT